MPTVIDSLIVELGLDPTGFTKGQKGAVSDLRKFQSEVNQTRRKAEDEGKKTGEAFFGRLKTEALSFLALLTGANGLKDFIASTTTMTANLGRLAYVTDQNVADLSAWQGIVKITGGDADEAAASIAGLIDQFQQMAAMGPTALTPWLNALQINVADPLTGKMRKLDDIFLDISAKFHAMDPAMANFYGHQMHLSQGLINVLIKGPDVLRKMLADQKALGVVTKEQADQAASLQAAWEGLAQASTSAGRAMLDTLSPGMVKVLNLMTSLITFGERGRLFFRGIADPMNGGYDLWNSLFGSDEDVHKDLGVPNALAPFAKPDKGARFDAAGNAITAPGAAGLGADTTIVKPAPSAAPAPSTGPRTDKARLELFRRYGLNAINMPMSDIERKNLADYADFLIKRHQFDAKGNFIGAGHPAAPHKGAVHHAALHAAAVRPGAGIAAHAAAGAHVDMRKTSSSEVNVGAVNIHTGATDADGIARTIVPAIRRNSLAAQADSGQN
jgi:hypothetical protein